MDVISDVSLPVQVGPYNTMYTSRLVLCISRKLWDYNERVVLAIDCLCSLRLERVTLDVLIHRTFRSLHWSQDLFIRRTSLDCSFRLLSPILDRFCKIPTLLDARGGEVTAPWGPRSHSCRGNLLPSLARASLYNLNLSIWQWLKSEIQTPLRQFKLVSQYWIKWWYYV